jgi:RNA polymerase sigma-70 factor (ECF subfamily)
MSGKDAARARAPVTKEGDAQVVGHKQRRPDSTAAANKVNEERLMVRYARGEQAAFRQLFALLAPRVLAFFRRSFPGESGTIDDLLQQTFLGLHRTRSSYREELPFRPWLFTIASRVRVDELRRRHRHPVDPTDGDLEESAAMVDAQRTTRQQDVTDVRDAIERLPESLRVVIHLHGYERLTFEEIARVLDTTPGATRARASRAYERLRATLRPRPTRGYADD